MLHVGQGNSQQQYTLGMKGLRAVLGRGAWALGDEELDMSQPWALTESQTCPGLLHKKWGQQVEGGDSVSLLCSGGTSAGVLHPALGHQHKNDMDMLENVHRGSWR